MSSNKKNTVSMRPIFSRLFQMGTVLAALCQLSFAAPTPAEEFIGPFPNWHNVKTEFGAVGDGKADDTKALQKALDILNNDTISRVLYIPAGTYRITATLTLDHATNTAIIGEDPLNVTFKWDGEKNGVMFKYSSVRLSRMQRITFDGCSKAGKGVWIRWKEGTEYFPTTWEIADMIFKDIQGIAFQGGDCDSGYQSTACEVSIVRSHFIRDSVGISVQDWNTVDFWVRQCLFQDNIFGIGCWIGGIHVYDCVFRRSKEADISHQDIEFMGIRNNFSTGSHCFIGSPDKHRDGLIHGFKVTAQGNIVVDAKETPLVFHQSGPIMLIDNTIQCRADKAPIYFDAEFGGDLVSVGNKYTCKDALRDVNKKKHRILSIDDGDISPSSIAVIKEPELPPFALHSASPIIEVKGKTDEAIKSAIDEAIKKHNGKQPVVHLPLGDYRISKTMTIPANADVRIVGDVGYIADVCRATRLFWNGPADGVLFLVSGPSQVQFKDFYIQGETRTIPFMLDNSDQKNGRVLLDQVGWNPYTSGQTEYGLTVNGLDFTGIEGRGLNGGGKIGSIQVMGGPRAGAGKPAPAHVNIFGATMNGFDVSNNGRLLITENWFETGKERNNNPIIRLNNTSGTFTYHNGKNQYHTLSSPGGLKVPTHEIKNFNGKVTFLGVTLLSAGFMVDEKNANQNVLVMGSSIGQQDYNGIAYNTQIGITKGPATTAVIYNDGAETDSCELKHTAKLWRDNYFYNSRGDTIHYYYEHYPQKGDTVRNNWIVSMLAHTRGERPLRDFKVLDKNTTDIRFFRVAMGNFKNGIVIKGLNSSQQ